MSETPKRTKKSATKTRGASAKREQKPVREPPFHVGAKLRAMRERAKKRQQDIAQEMGVLQTRVAHIESQPDAKFSVVAAFAKACGRTTMDLL